MDPSSLTDSLYIVMACRGDGFVRCIQGLPSSSWYTIGEPIIWNQCGTPVNPIIGSRLTKPKSVSAVILKSNTSIGCLVILPRLTPTTSRTHREIMFNEDLDQAWLISTRPALSHCDIQEAVVVARKVALVIVKTLWHFPRPCCFLSTRSELLKD